MDLLIHVSAPSSRRDDEKFKQQARAYSAFEAVNIVTIQRHSDASPQGHEALNPSSVSTKGHDITVTQWTPSLYLDDTQLARTALESQLITSSLVRGPDFLDLDPESTAEGSATALLGSKQLAEFTQENNLSAKNENFLKRRHSASPECSPKNHHHVPPTTYLSLQEGSDLAIGHIESKQPSVTASTPKRIKTLVGGIERRQSSSLRSDDIPSQLPSTYALSDVTSKGSPRRDWLPLSSPVQALPSTPSRRVGKGVYHTSSPLRPSSLLRPDPPVYPHHSDKQSSPGLDAASSEHDSNFGMGRRHSAIRLALGVQPSDDSEHAAQASHVQLAKPPATSSVRRRSVVHDERHVLEPSNSHSTQDQRPPSAGSVDNTYRPYVSLQVTESITAIPPPSRLAPRITLSLPSTPAKPGELEILRSLSMSIYPSPDPPATSSEPFVSHITRSLDTLGRREELLNVYQPSSSIRPIRQSERGYWLVDPSGWSVCSQVDFWLFLQRHIGDGSAGWGVWCTRELDDENNHDDSSAANSSGRAKLSRTCLGQVKVFCWGETVQHIYKMLYIASKAKIRRNPPAWIGGDGEVIVQTDHTKQEKGKNVG